jgi:hypothetical protein
VETARRDPVEREDGAARARIRHGLVDADEVERHVEAAVREHAGEPRSATVGSGLAGIRRRVRVDHLDLRGEAGRPVRVGRELAQELHGQCARFARGAEQDGMRAAWTQAGHRDPQLVGGNRVRFDGDAAHGPRSAARDVGHREHDILRIGSGMHGSSRKQQCNQ